MLTIDPNGQPGVWYNSAEEVREHIAFLAETDSDTLADLACGLLAELEAERGRDRG
jgi:hypothetical protein